MEHFFEKIQGWFQCEQLYREMVAQANDGAVFVEVGAWKGRSAAFMAVEIINSGKNITFHVVDHFRGSREHETEGAITNGTLMSEFCENMRPVYGNYNLIATNSVTAAATFADASCDFVYIDASHEYEDVRWDIQAWLPKMKPGGVLAGDDYNVFPGVTKAVSELLPDAYIGGQIWRFTCPAST